MTAQPRDFPDWLGPMLVKELRQGLKARAFVITFIALQTLFVIAVSFSALFYARHREEFNPGTLNSIFWLLVGAHLLLVTPLRALNALAGERKANTIELIFMTGLTSWRIAFGKWASLMFQAALFVLAVLPYGIVRYYFGAVNLAEDLLMLGLMSLASALLTATMLAISGLPIFFRIAMLALSVPAATVALPVLFFDFRTIGVLRLGGGAEPGVAFWLLVVFSAVLLIAGLLESAAATVAPPAENHALRQRLIALAALLPLPVMAALRVDWGWLLGQLVFFGTIAGSLAFQHLSIAPLPLRTHLEPFRKRGRGAAIVGAFFQPGWPSATLFLVLAAAIVIGIGWITWEPTARGLHEPPRELQEQSLVVAVILMGLAALLTPAVLLNLLPRRPKFMPAAQGLVLLAGAGLAIPLSILNYKGGSPLFENPWLGLFPPLGIWAMLELRPTNPMVIVWLKIGAAMSALCVLILMMQARGYWRRVRSIHAAICRKSDAPALEAVSP